MDLINKTSSSKRSSQRNLDISNIKSEKNNNNFIYIWLLDYIQKLINDFTSIDI